MRTKRFDRRITIQRSGTFTDNEGITIEGWIDFVTVWAMRQPLKGHEFFAAAAINAQNTVRYKVRTRTDLSADMRFIDRKDNRVYNITAPPEDVYGDGLLHIMATEELRNG